MLNPRAIQSSKEGNWQLGSGDRGTLRESAAISFQEYAIPKLQVQQTPNSSGMIPVSCPMFGEEPAHGFGAHEASLRGSGIKQHFLDGFTLGTRKPQLPGSGKAQFLAVKHNTGQER